MQRHLLARLVKGAALAGGAAMVSGATLPALLGPPTGLSQVALTAHVGRIGHERVRQSGSAPALTGAAVFSDGFQSLPISTWQDGQVHGAWSLAYGGYGSVGIEGDPTVASKVLTEQPKTSTRPGQTHAALVTSVASFGDLDLTVRLRTVAQLRTGSPPNPWEVGWVLWHYTDDSHFYYFLAKPNGWELGKEDPAYPGAQRYLLTGSSPRFPIGSWYTVRVVQVGDTMTVWVDGARIASYTDHQRPYGRGSVGLYDEDAHVHFARVDVGA